MIQAITFDLWNTLIINKSYSEQRLENFFQFLQEKEIFSSFDELKKAYDKKFHFTEITFEEIEFRHIYTEERILNVLKELNIEISKDNLDILKQDFESLMLQDPPLLKESVKITLEKLAPDFQLGLISNTGVTPGRVLSKVLDEYNILDMFDVTVFSDESGYFKPHPKMFEIPLKMLKCKRENAIHVGDKLETDIKGAKDFNMFTIWFNDLNLPRSGNIQPDYEIHHFNQLIQIVKDLT